ncbi:MAG: leucyl/phenylalanyl-tRNA--protein transferase, partial [Candidatus Nanopelagicales bacterium]|nr:leucyl/phenylalanyl-tRNA--protein transferase [Candidatus Nanopelagicales bacterium]
ADPNRPHGWITEEFVDAYAELHRRGYAHSIEVWQDGDLVGGLYGVEVGGLFAGESMFHRRRDASKVALVALVEILRSHPGKRLIDVQWCTEHLASLGAIEITRAEYLATLATVVNEEPCLGGGATADRF